MNGFSPGSGRSRMGLVAWIMVVVVIQQASALTLKIAWMAPEPFFFFFNASTSMGALAYSIQTIKDDASLLPAYDRFEVRFKNSGCNEKEGVGAIFDFFEDGYDMDFIMGPACSPAMRPVAAIASHLNLPAFGWISSDPIVADKSLYTTLVRFLWPIAAIGDGLLILLEKTGWRNIFLISTTGNDYGPLGSSVREAFTNRPEEEGYVIARWVQEVPEKPDAGTMSNIFDQVKGEARIVVLSVPDGELRDWMLAAYDKGMDNGEYVFLYVNQLTPQEGDVARFYSTDFWSADPDADDGRNDDARKIYGSLIMMLAKPTTDFNKTRQYLDNFETASRTPPWINNLGQTPSKPDFYSLFLYDAMMLYARVAQETGSVRDGELLFSKAAGSLTKDGATGDVILDNNADRVPDYWFFDMDEEGRFDIFAETVSEKVGASIERDINVIIPFLWGDGSRGMDNAPPDVPKCDFDGSKCKSDMLYIIIGVVGGVLILIIIVVFFICRKLKYERDLNNMVWKINYDDVHIYTGGKGPAGSQFNLRSQSQRLRTSKGSLQESVGGQLFVTVANYRGNTVAIRNVRKNRIKLDRNLLREMRTMIEVKHNNLNAFTGACIDAPNVCCAWEYCNKGSLQDVIYNEKIALDDMFKFSIGIDALKGIMYIHDSDLKHHGKLKSSNILIDGRWISKISDYGVEHLTSGEEPDEDESDHAKYTKLFWTAPEVLREEYEAFQQTSCIRAHHPSADVYSMGVILKELFCRNAPYTENEDDNEPQEIVAMVMKPEGSALYRPPLEELEDALQEKSIALKLSELIRSCWAEEPKDRPTAHHAMKTLSKINPNKKTNVLDNVMAMLEKYTNQLEGTVAERTVQLQEEKKKTEDLLYKMLPKSVADDLKMGRPIQAESFDTVTMYFSDIVGFKDVAEVSTPYEIVDLLNEIYSLMDGIICQHDVYKVETVGDVYLLVSGLPIRNGDRHVVEVLNCAIDIISATYTFKVRHTPHIKIGVRVGIHTGAVVAGVIGLTNPRYCLFGDTVNTSSRMESNGFANRIHMSSFAYAALSKFAGFHVAERGVIQVKGKGAMTTYWAMGREGYDKPLPDFRKMIFSDTPTPKMLPQTSGKSVVPRIMRPSMESGFSEMADNADMADATATQRTSVTSTVIMEDRTQRGGLPVVEISGAG